ncbi:MAG: hypothetical protein IJZ22_04055 [Bacteroidaceae bacterium]|nr:hypothetical protein [Bacteroidaceae bacterium]
MKNLKFCLIALVALMFTGCAKYSTDGVLMGMAGNTINTYVAADLDYKNAKRVTATVEDRRIFFIPLLRNGNKQFVNINRYKGLNKAQRQALYRAKVNNDVDIIMEPEFSTESHSYFFGAFKSRKVTVTGWGVNMKGIKEDTRARSEVNSFANPISRFGF